MPDSPNHPEAVAVDLEERLPSGKTLIEEMREFALGLDDELGPMFGRDVVRVLDALPALLASVREARELREAVAKVLSRGRSGDGWLEVPPKEVEALAALQEPK